MWTLVIIVVMSSIQAVAGTSNSIHSVGGFSTEEKCAAAARAIAVNAGTIPVDSANGAFQVRTHCVQQ